MAALALLTTGGTIATARNPRTGDLEVALSATQVAELVDEVGLPVSVEEVFRLPSTEVTLRHLVLLVDTIERTAAGDVSGIVVTHGTATMEETAFFVALSGQCKVPIVFTGAMRDASAADADGPRNMTDALNVAAAVASRGRGVLVVMDGQILNAVSATKWHANRVGAFAARHGGPEGWVGEAGILFFRPPQPPPIRFTRRCVEPRVELVRTYLALEPGVIASCIDRGSKGVVVEAMGEDGIAPALKKPLLGALNNGVAVAVATRCPEGASSPRYPVAQELARAGAAFTRTLDGLKARILLMLAIGESPGRTDFQELFDHIAGCAPCSDNRRR
jgi:L-asparaginase